MAEVVNLNAESSKHVVPVTFVPAGIPEFGPLGLADRVVRFVGDSDAMTATLPSPYAGFDKELEVAVLRAGLEGAMEIHFDQELDRIWIWSLWPSCTLIGGD